MGGYVVTFFALLMTNFIMNVTAVAISLPVVLVIFVFTSTSVTGFGGQLCSGSGLLSGI